MMIRRKAISTTSFARCRSERERRAREGGGRKEEEGNSFVMNLKSLPFKEKGSLGYFWEEGTFAI